MLNDRDEQAPDDALAGPQRGSDHGAGPVAHVRASAARASPARECDETPGLRDQAARERDVHAQQRDQLSMRRDEFAKVHDTEARDLDAEEIGPGRHTLLVKELRARDRASRIRATSDRAQAAHDRQQSALDRELAARDREHAGTDELTGARRRGIGLEELGNEMERARRESDGSLVAAFVDVDGLKSVNDMEGHAAGDALLRAVADGLRRHTRSYDLVVRLGGDEFLCALPNVTLVEARARFDRLRTDLAGSGSSVGIGCAELRDGDSADDLVGRADSALRASRRDRAASALKPREV